MTRKTLDQLALSCDRPFFDVRCQPVGVGENEICNIHFAEFFGPFRGAGESVNHSGESRGRITGVFFPAVLSCDWALEHLLRGSTDSDYTVIKRAERIVLVQSPRHEA